MYPLFELIMETANFFDENEISEELFVLMDTVLNETTYLLASETNPEEDEDCECFILKLVSDKGEEVLYETVDDEVEFASVSKIFEELLEEEDIELT